MAGNGWKWLKMALGTLSTLKKNTFQYFWNGRLWGVLAMPLLGNPRLGLDLAGNGWKMLEMVGVVANG